MLELTELARRIQRVRTERELTLAALAERSSVSVSMLSAIERAAKAPTVLVLDRIADGLGVPLASLLGSDEDSPRLVVRRQQDRSVHPTGWEKAVLSPVVAGVNFELIRVTLPPGCDAGAFPAYAPGSHEYVAVETGALRLTVGDQVVRLVAGESAYFEADQVHEYANPENTPCTYYVAALIMRARR